MSDEIELELRDSSHRAIDLDGVTPDRVADLSERAIAALPIRVDGRTASLGDLFAIRGGGAARLWLEGNLSACHGVGAGMQSGEMVVASRVGSRAGAGMRGGTLTVLGAGDDAAQAMAGGVLHIAGNAGHRLAAGSPGASKGMTGGEVIVAGSTGDDTAARARRGLVVVCGATGARAGRSMIAGTLVVFGRVGPHPVEGNKRGSLVALGPVDVPPTYTYACTYEPGYIRLLMTHLTRRLDLMIPAGALDGSYRRYCGDASGIGKGEILQLVHGR